MDPSTRLFSGETVTNLYFSSNALIPDEIARIREIFLSVRSPLGCGDEVPLREGTPAKVGRVRFSNNFHAFVIWLLLSLWMLGSRTRFASMIELAR